MNYSLYGLKYTSTNVYCRLWPIIEIVGYKVNGCDQTYLVNYIDCKMKAQAVVHVIDLLKAGDSEGLIKIIGKEL